ncbi:MAG: hypothetical protein KAU89_02330 [Candidatus Thorarchaeota archaeon]|jgi:DNA-directed RNA polymerase subunit RPC12/RpoP|nr:hypothetical protein [Candidatus Thorarchaeota archaeon]
MTSRSDTIINRGKTNSSSRGCFCICGLWVLPIGLFLIASVMGGFDFIPNSLVLGIIMVIVGITMFAIGIKSLKKDQTRAKLHTEILRSAVLQDSVSISEMSEKTGLPYSEVRNLIADALLEQKLIGTMDEDVFRRSESPVSEVLLTRNIPSQCFKCGADVNPEEVDWIGPDKVRCSHCGASLVVEVERVRGDRE